MNTAISDNNLYYVFHAFPLALVWGLLFFILGMALGRFFWHSRRDRAKIVERSIKELEEERARLKKSMGGSR